MPLLSSSPSPSPSAPSFDVPSGLSFIKKMWAIEEKSANGGEDEEGIFSHLCRFIRIPNQSPAFDAHVLTNGHQDEAVELIKGFAVRQGESGRIQGLHVKVSTEKGHTPCLMITVKAFRCPDETEKSGRMPSVLMYGHGDKQPPMQGWDEGLSAREPVLRDGKLYGRGSSDDGYAVFAALSSIAALQEQKVPHGRIAILIEFCEESGSVSLPLYLDRLKDDIGTPSLVVCIDSGCGTYDALWLTSSLRGMLCVNLTVQILTEGVHSGSASGIVPSSFRIMRMLLDRIENAETGKLPDVCYADIPEADKQFACAVANTVGEQIVRKFPWVEGSGPLVKANPQHKYTNEELAEFLLRATWQPTLSYTGIEGMPLFPAAGNVLRPKTSIKLSIRLPPTLAPEPVYEWLQKELTRDVPFGAKVIIEHDKGAQGFAAPTLAPWLRESFNTASKSVFGKAFYSQGEGGSIPFMHLLQERFPGCNFMVCGVLGPNSNAHGPNEFLLIDMAQKVTACISNVIADHCKHAN